MFFIVVFAALPLMIKSDNATVLALETALFNGMDINKDGNVVLAEAVQFFMAFDINHDSGVSYVEFTTSLEAIAPALKAYEKTFFSLFDVNDNQFVEQSDINVIFKQVDTNHDGAISRQEFNIVFEAIAQQVG